MTSNEFQDWLRDVISEVEFVEGPVHLPACDDENDGGPVEVRTFEDAKLITNNAGLIVKIGENKFLVTIVKSR